MVALVQKDHWAVMEINKLRRWHPHPASFSILGWMGPVLSLIYPKDRERSLVLNWFEAFEASWLPCWCPPSIISSYIYWYLHIFFAKVSVQIFCLFYVRMFVFIILSFESTWYILDISLLSDFCSENIFSLFVAFLNSIFQREGVLNFDEVQFVIFFFYGWSIRF